MLATCVITVDMRKGLCLFSQVGGVNTNFPMPDVQSIGLGGGSVVTFDSQSVSFDRYYFCQCDCILLLELYRAV